MNETSADSGITEAQLRRLRSLAAVTDEPRFAVYVDSPLVAAGLVEYANGYEIRGRLRVQISDKGREAIR